MFIARSYRAKIIAYITPLIGSICLLYFAFFLYRSSRIFKEELIDKGFSLSKALSYSCELGVLSEDEVFLKSSLVGILEEEDVLSAIVYNEEGKAIASNEKVEAELNIPPQILKRIKEEREPLRIVAYTERGEETYGFISPILATSFISGANTGAQREVVGFTKVILSLKRVRAQNRLMLITALMMTILIIGLGVGISTILAKGVTRPIGDLLDGVKAISQGNLNYRIQVKSKDEIGQLALSFNQMTEDLKERTRQAKESEERYKNLFESVKDAIFTSDKQGRLTDVNRAFLKMFGYKDREEVIGCDIAEKFYLRGEEGRKLAKRLKEKGFVTDYEIEVKRKDGTPFFISATSNLKRDEEGEIIGTEGILRDVTERKKMEQKLQDYTENLEKRVEERTKELKEANKELEDALTNLKNLQSQLLQSEKMASIGQLAAGVAHEMNNPIGFIHCNLETLQGYVEDVTRLLHKYDELEGVLQGSKREEADSIHQQLEDLKKEIDLDFVLEDLSKVVSETREGSERLAKIVRDLKDFSHVDEAELKYANINEGIESTLNIVWNELKYKAEVVKEYGELPDVACYPQQLNQVFMNLLVNAAQAIEERGKIKIKTFSDDEHIYIQISDTGMGIPQENLSRIFEPFFTTKEVGKGTGLGLSMSYGIIKKHQGKIDVESHLGEGTTFTIELPLRAAREGETPG